MTAATGFRRAGAGPTTVPAWGRALVVGRGRVAAGGPFLRLGRVLAPVLVVAVAACRPTSSETEAAQIASTDLTRVEGLGSIAFPNSGAPEAQDGFVRGVLLLHSFEYGPAAEAFREAQDADPDFAMAYWGEAMTYNHPLWQQKDREAAVEALGRLAPTPEERAAKAGTERERLYLAAVEALFGTTGPGVDAPGPERKAREDRAYADAMRRLHEAYPEDDEARTFYALAILGTRDGSREFATYMRAAATAQSVFDRNPDHPGAAHYMIHSFDDPIHAPLGLQAARAYSEIAPRAAHAQHMTSHIFVAMGMWDDVIRANERATSIQDGARAEAGASANACGHYSSWLHYGLLMKGELQEAERVMDACHERIMDDPTGGGSAYFAAMRARHVLDTEDWSLADRWVADLGDPATSQPALVDAFTNAFAALRKGDPGPARALLAVEANGLGRAATLHLDELRGMLAIHDGDVDRGLEILGAAAEEEDALPFEFGPPRVVKPTFELLGEELLRAGRPDRAEAAFRRATERTPGRTLATRGLAETMGGAPGD